MHFKFQKNKQKEWHHATKPLIVHANGIKVYNCLKVIIVRIYREKLKRLSLFRRVCECHTQSAVLHLTSIAGELYVQTHKAKDYTCKYGAAT